MCTTTCGVGGTGTVSRRQSDPVSRTCIFRSRVYNFSNDFHNVDAVLGCSLVSRTEPTDRPTDRRYTVLVLTRIPASLPYIKSRIPCQGFEPLRDTRDTGHGGLNLAENFHSLRIKSCFIGILVKRGSGRALASGRPPPHPRFSLPTTPCPMEHAQMHTDKWILCIPTDSARCSALPARTVFSLECVGWRCCEID